MRIKSLCFIFKDMSGIDRLNIDELRTNFGPFQKKRNFFVVPEHTRKFSLKEPYRTQTYGLSLVTGGRTVLVADLTSYEVTPPSLIAMGPEIIRQWKEGGNGTQNTALFFTKDFFVKDLKNIDYLKRFPFFGTSGTHNFPITKKQELHLRLLFSIIADRQDRNTAHSNDAIRSYISALLHEVADIYESVIHKTSVSITNGHRILRNFKDLLAKHFRTERSVQFYADQLFINPKYLSQVVKEESGKSPSDWVNEMVMLEAKVLLQNVDLNISEVARELHFSDASFFGKFFKRHEGRSPKAFRASLA